MGLVLILAEKPSQARAYADAFQKTAKKDGYIVVTDHRYFQDHAIITWGFGHLVELVKPGDYKKEWGKWRLDNLPILPDHFKFDVPRDKKKQFNIVKNLLNQADEIIVATDADREGENIARSIIRHAGAEHKPTKRLWINSLEVAEIQKGFKNLKPGHQYLSIYEEAQSRQIADWLVGMNASPLYSLLLQKKGISAAFSIGRVQTPTLYMIYTRQQEINNFKPEPFFELYADVNVQNGVFKARYKERFTKKEDVQALLVKHGLQEQENGHITKLTKELKQTKSPKLHSLSTLQSKANKRWKYSPSSVLQTVQRLYEKKLLTYPRTDANYITNSEFAYLKGHLSAYQSVANVSFEVAYPAARKRYVDSSKVQEHYAIIPTKTVPSQKTLAGLNAKEKNIYFEVLLNTIAMFAPDYQYEETNVEADVKGIVFQASGKIEKVKGWKSLFLHEHEDKEKEQEPKLPAMREGEPALVKPAIKEDVTKPPRPYTEGQLINMMKTCGRAIEDEDAQQILKDIEGIGTEATRASIIETLKNREYIAIKKNKVEVTKKGEILCQSVEGNLLSKPEMTAQWEKFLRLIGEGKKTKEVFLKNINKFICHLIEQTPSQLASISIEHNIEEAQNEKMIGACPSCKKGYIVDKGKFYGCSGYQNGCRFTLPKLFLGKKISKTNLKKLLSAQKTNLIKGFKSKSGKTFNAYLQLKDGKIEMDFGNKN
ncbi:type IA DNA topoisomerase [Scopulibacillus cellulosilyticus]|uniref:DNA topoisomerase n=1 Tax=Scopulibacillus cellulosilyticus TaxID=2665665 RepID=A0ABW2PZG0_9BACL